MTVNDDGDHGNIDLSAETKPGIKTISASTASRFVCHTPTSLVRLGHQNLQRGKEMGRLLNRVAVSSVFFAVTTT